MIKRIVGYIGKVLLYFVAISLFLVLFYGFVPVLITPLQVIRLVEQTASGKPLTLKKDWEPLSNISPHLPHAVIAAEDQRFMEHFGFDVEAIQKAIKHNQKKRKKNIKGASTISQQTAKNVFLWPGRSYVRKGLEAWFTVLIEIFWPKKRIIEVYLNVIEMGDGIYGAEAASKVYFGKSAKRLSASEAARIASILPNPIKYSALKPGRYVQKRQGWILRNMRNLPRNRWD